MLKTGFGFYHHMLTEDYFRFARQCGATHAVVHLVDYFSDHNAGGIDQPVGTAEGWGVAGATLDHWTEEWLSDLKTRIESHGLTLEAIENLDPALWYDILLEGPRRELQIVKVKEIIRILGRVGIPILGYNFSIAGVTGRITGSFARGGAESVGMDGVDQSPLPNGMVWNMWYDKAAPRGFVPSITHDELWRRLDAFLSEVIPIAESAGVRLAAHPDDPPVPFLRGQPRLVYQPHMYDRLLEVVRSPSNQLEFCLGTIAEMTEGDVYEATERYAAKNAIAYVHFRNVRGKAPHYKEVFIDEGDIDMRKIVGIMKKCGYNGVIIPDHTPQMTCSAPWHAGMAYAMGYMSSLIRGDS